MSWIKLDNQTFAEEGTPDPQRVVNIVELQAEIDTLTKQIADTEARLLAYPENTNSDMKQVIDDFNEQLQGEIAMWETGKQEKETLKIELESL